MLIVPKLPSLPRFGPGLDFFRQAPGGPSYRPGQARRASSAAEGAAVVVNYASSREGAERVVAGIHKEGGQAVAVQANVAQPADIPRLFATTRQAFGGLDILVNNAGVYEFKPLEEITPEHFHRLFDLNVLGLLLATQAALPLFGEKGGSVINIGSAASTYAPPQASAYSATKGAVDMLTKSLAKELGPRKIRVNTVAPGMVDTEGARDGGYIDSDFRRQLEAQTPVGRIGRPEDVATVTAFLASDDASWVSGETWFVSGGLR